MSLYSTNLGRNDFSSQVISVESAKMDD